ncbi:MAG: hypothetical protein ACKOQY_06510 [Bacteroidota bacterium]
MRLALLLWLCCTCFLPVFAQEIRRAEYFIDIDPGVNNGNPIQVVSPAYNVFQSVAVPTAGLAHGFHIVYIRTCNAVGVWSLSEGRTFTVSPVIVAAEYFVDSDPGVGNGTSISPGSVADSVNWSFSLPTITLTSGVHLLYVRTRNSAGVWSLSEGRSFTVSPVITAAEYFFNTDPGVGAGNALAVPVSTDSLHASYTIPTVGLLPGANRLYIRTKTSEGKWSLSEPRIIDLSSDPGLTVKLFIEGFYLGGGQMASVLDPVNRPHVSDSITIALADTLPPYSILSSIPTVLYTDGSVQLVYPSGFFGRSYYIVIRHRNTIETWSKSPVPLKNNMVLYDFSTGPVF